MTWDAPKQRAFGWSFLLGISAFNAVLNLGGMGLLLAPLEPLFRLDPMTDSPEPGLWQLALGWFVIALIYVPAYWVLAFSTKHFGWSFREWGFRFALVFLRRFLPPSRYRTVLAILVSSTPFCLAHTHFAPSQLVSLFLGGALPLAAFTVWSRSLCLSLVIHGAVGGGHVGALAALLFYLVLTIFSRRSTSPQTHHCLTDLR